MCILLTRGTFSISISKLKSYTYNYRIIELLRLEKTSEMIKSNCQPSTTMPAKPCPEVPYVHILIASKDGDCTTSLGRLLCMDIKLS